MEKGNKSGAEFLRQKAEELLKKKSAAERGKLSEVDTQKLIHELEVHQIELEMQNDELRHAWAVAEVASDKYTTLYDFSPTGYLSLSKEGKITELNLYAAQLLGKERLYLKGLRFGIFVSNDTRGAFNQFLGHIFSNKAKETCELTLLPKANSTVYVHLSGIAATKGEECLVSLIDITERTQAEMALRESEEKFKALIEGAKDGIILVTNDRSRVVMNEAFARMHGYTVDEMNNLNLKDLDTPETSRLSPARLQKILAGESMTFEAEHFCKSGQTFPVEVSANLVTIGGRTYILGFHRDISERKRIQAALQDNERQLWESQEVAHLGSFVWDISAGLWKSSAILDDILGIDDNYIRSLEGWEAIIHPEWRDTMVDFVTKEILAKHQRFDKEYKIINQKSGKEIWVHGFAKLEIDNNNQPIKLIGTLTDITKQRLADEALQNSKSLVDATLESIHNGILVINQQGAVIKTNARFAELWHIPKSLIDEADDKTLLDFVLEQLADPDEFIKKITELYGKPESVGFELIYFKDGRVFERISKPIHNEYEQKGRVWSFLDITDRKRYEEELKYKNKELQKLNTEKDKFFSVLAHDLRSPFNSLLGFTQLLIEDLPTMTEAQIYKIALTMRRSAINLFRLLENLLEWSRIQRGLIAFNPEPRLLMPKVLADTALVMESANKKEITLNYNIPEELEVYADENMLGSILRNLAGNAVKFSPKGGKVTISAKQLHNAVECSVSDTGIGMNQEMKENLFNIDVNTNRKGTEKEPSTGLGLIICKEFVEKHGGRLWVESEEGKGSTFYFTLHFTTEYKPEEVITKVVSAGNAAGQSRKLKILIVEDDEISDSLISIMVEKYGKEIIHSITGIKALEACRKNPDLDLVLMDINLPEIDGFEATRQIRQFNKDVIIIAQTAYSNDFPDFRQKLTDAGCNDYILKPIDHNELKGLIRKYFSF